MFFLIYLLFIILFLIIGIIVLVVLFSLKIYISVCLNSLNFFLENYNNDREDRGYINIWLIFSKLFDSDKTRLSRYLYLSG